MSERKYVKRVFNNFKQNELYLKNHELPRLTTDYQLAMSFTGNKVSVVEDIACKRTDALTYNQQVLECVNRLKELERKIIYLSYIENKDLPTWAIWEQLHIGRTLFFTTKRTAIEKLAILFKTYGL